MNNNIKPLTQTTDDEVQALKEFAKIMDKAAAGDKSTLPVIQRAIAKTPGIVDQLGGDLAKTAQDSLIISMTGQDLVSQQVVAAKLAAMRADLLGQQSSPIAKLLVERAIACWLQVQHADIHHAQAKSVSLAQAEFSQRRMTHAHRRYLAALKTLGIVRKLAVPTVQINIARKQVNQVNTAPIAE